jgi:hypothetical protein
MTSENPYEPPQEIGAQLPRRQSGWIVVRQILITGAGATIGAALCMPVISSPPPVTTATILSAWLQSAVGAILGGLLFAWTSRIVWKPPEQASQ